MHARYLYPEITEFTAEDFVTVWENASDTTYMECIGCDTTGMYKSGVLNMAKGNYGSEGMGYVDFHSYDEAINYKLGLKSLYRVAVENNRHYITGFKQNKMEINLNMAGKAYLENCVLDTLFVNCQHGPFDKELVIGYECYIKHILLNGGNPSGEVAAEIRLTAEGSQIDNLEVKNVFENTFKLSVPARLLTYTNFTLNGRQVTGKNASVTQ